MPLNAGVDVNRVLGVVFVERVVFLNDAGVFLVLLFQLLTDGWRQLANAYPLTCDCQQWVTHRVPQQDIAVEVIATQAVLADVHEDVAAEQQVQDRLVDHHPVIARLDAAKHRQLELVQRQLDL